MVKKRLSQWRRTGGIAPVRKLSGNKPRLLMEHGQSLRQAIEAQPDLTLAEQDRPDVAQARAHWRAEHSTLSPARLVFIDEAAAKTNMTRTRGRAPKGQRLVAACQRGHWRTTTKISSEPLKI